MWYARLLARCVDTASSFVGPSGHGKSFVAHRCECLVLFNVIQTVLKIRFLVSSLLDIPSHTGELLPSALGHRDVLKIASQST